MPIFQKHPGLLAEFRGGTSWALDKVYRAYEGTVSGALAGWSRSNRASIAGMEISDLTQEVFLRAFLPSARHAYDTLRPYGPFLITIAHNLVIDLRRRSSRRVRGAASLTALTYPDTVEERTPSSGANQKLSVIVGHVRSLPESLRDLYRLRFVEGHAQERTAAALGISRQNVRTLEARLRSELHRLLDDRD